MKRPLVVIVGPTAVGKTALSIMLAKRFQGEIINGDAFQVYQGLDIGTAKVIEEEKENIPHHLLDFLPPTASFSAAEFQKLAKEKIMHIRSRHKLPILVGGTGMYVKSVTAPWTFQHTPEDEKMRADLQTYADENGSKALHAKLYRLDRKAAARIHPNNIRKVIRALEVLLAGNDAPSPLQKEPATVPPYPVFMIGLTMDRERLYARINERVEMMLETGLLQEVKELYHLGIRHAQAMQGIGYKELIPYIEGRISFEEAVDTLKKNSRRFAKRQLTWFHNKENVTWFTVSEETYEQVFQEICTFVAGKLEMMSNE